MGGNKNIRPEDRTAGFDVNPQNINKKGPPRKSYSQHIHELKAKGYSAPTKSEFYDIVGLLFSMTEDDMREFMDDKSRPMWIQNIVRDLGNKMVRTRMMCDYRDWIFGKAKEHLNVEGEVTIIRKIIDARNDKTS